MGTFIVLVIGIIAGAILLMAFTREDAKEEYSYGPFSKVMFALSMLVLHPLALYFYAATASLVAAYIVFR